MKEEELIKQLENIDLPMIEVKSHRNRLRTVLIQSWDNKEQPGPGFPGFTRLKMMVPMILYRPIWQKALAITLVVAMIIGLSSIFLLGRDPSGQNLPWEKVAAKTSDSMNDVTSFHFYMSDTTYFETQTVETVEGDFLAPDRIQWITKIDREPELEGELCIIGGEICIIGDKIYSRDSGTCASEWELTLMGEINGQQVAKKYGWDSQTGEWYLIDWYDSAANYNPWETPLSMFPSIPAFVGYVQPVNIAERLNHLNDVEQLPDEVIDDTDCLHYKGKSDMPFISEGSEETPTVEIWIGKYDYLVRQYRWTASNLTQTRSYSDFNESVEIEAPYDGIVPDEGEPFSSKWSSMASNTTKSLYGIWGSSASDIFTVGTDGTILHYDGNSWSQMSSGTTEELLDVWGSSASDVFTVGMNGTILHYDGSEWSTIASYTTEMLNGIWGSSSSDVFTVGANGTILHYDGSEWSEISSGIYNYLYSVWGSSSSDVFAVGTNGTILHYDGNSWSQMSIVSIDNTDFTDVWGSSPSDVFTSGNNYVSGILHYDGNSWTTMETPNFYLPDDVWGSSSSDVFAVGYYGTILHYDGDTWKMMYTGVLADLTCIWGSASSDVFAVGANGTILHYDG